MLKQFNFGPKRRHGRAKKRPWKSCSSYRFHENMDRTHLKTNKYNEIALDLAKNNDHPNKFFKRPNLDEFKITKWVSDRLKSQKKTH